jgi:protein-S-isoprenylcysteine O-methyltransferase Ste14
MTQSTPNPELRRGIARWVIRNTIIVIIAAACLFGTSRDIRWAMAWAYLGVLLASKVAIALILSRSNPELLAERGGVPEDVKAWDRPLAMLMALYGPALGWIAAGLDRLYGWSITFSTPVQVAALVVSALSGALTLWAMASNRFFLGFCRIATERGHSVATAGPYHYVRHPGYVGVILYQLATPLALDSLWAFLPVALTIALTALRTSLEDRTLQEELPGYAEYVRQVRYRLLPGIW